MKNFWSILIIIIAILLLIHLIDEVDGQELPDSYNVYSSDNYEYNPFGDKLLFVVDFSNSMGEYLEHKSKFSQVKNCLREILPQISKSTKVGLRVYGHTCNIFAYNACRSSELVAPLKENNSNTILSSISGLKPKGMTPITYSLKQAVKKDFANLDGIKHIILLTDGGENCDESPCNYAIELMKERRDIKIDVVAFNVHEEEDLDQLRCVADVTSGKFFEADTNAQLLNSMQNLVLPHKQVQATLYKMD